MIKLLDCATECLWQLLCCVVCFVRLASSNDQKEKRRKSRKRNRSNGIGDLLSLLDSTMNFGLI